VATNPLFEVFEFLSDNMTEPAKRHREHRLCPFNNKVPNCTKDKVYYVLRYLWVGTKCCMRTKKPTPTNESGL
jgi:hypothetical protein